MALEPALTALARWSQEHIDAEMALCTGAVSNVMLKVPRHILSDVLPRRRVVLQIRFSEPDLEYDTYWAICQPGAMVEVCTSIPGFDVDLYVEADVVSVSGTLLNRTTVSREVDLGHLFVSGDPVRARTIDAWLVGTDFATVEAPRLLPETRRAVPA